MPIISEFYGIRICMYFKEKEHGVPHIHVSYGGRECVVSLLTCEILSGSLPRKAEKMMLRWVKKNVNELLVMWETEEYRRFPGM